MIVRYLRTFIIKILFFIIIKPPFFHKIRGRHPNWYSLLKLYYKWQFKTGKHHLILQQFTINFFIIIKYSSIKNNYIYQNKIHKAVNHKKTLKTES